MSSSTSLAILNGSLPTTQTAIVQANDGTLYIKRDAPLPDLKHDQILVRVAAVALNPCDFKMAERFPAPGATDGCDFSGRVVAIGTDAARTSHFRLGERVFGAVHGSNPIDLQSGSFAEYVAIDAGFLFHTPDYLADETAAAIGGTGLGTLGLALYKSLGLSGTPKSPTEEGEFVLVYGGSTSVGTMGLQLLKLSGYRTIATCSPRNFELVRSYGADYVFDYNDPDVVDKIRTLTGNALRYALDIIAEVKTTKNCYAAIGRAGGKYTSLEKSAEHLHNRKTVKPELVMGIRILGKRIALDHGYGSEASPELRDFGVEWYHKLQGLLDERRIRSHPVKIIPGGFQGILNGLQLLKTKAVSAQKMVVKIAEL